jgi:hypothetical protein
MRSTALLKVAVVLALAGLCVAARAEPLPKTTPYKKIAVTMPVQFTDPTLDAFRKQLASTAQRKDRKALDTQIVSQGFFWKAEGDRTADEKKSGLENLAVAIGLDDPNERNWGWSTVSDHATEETVFALEGHKDTVCSPARPIFDQNEFIEVMKDTYTSRYAWAYTIRHGFEVRETPAQDSKVLETIGMQLIRMFIESDGMPSFFGNTVLVATPSGNVGFILADALDLTDADQLCYTKFDDGWKITGFIGRGMPQ